MAQARARKKTSGQKKLRKPPKQYVAWSPRVEEAIVQSMVDGSSLKAACAAAAVSYRSATEHMSTDPRLRDRIVMARELPVGSVEGSLYKAAVAVDQYGRGDTLAKKFFLTNRAPDRWSDKVDVNSHGDIAIRESSGDGANAFTPEEQAALRGIAKKRILQDDDPDGLPY